MTPFALLVKPVGATCNIACDYCFYREKSALYPHGPALMPDAVLEHMLDTYLALPFDAYSVIFQGGEPLLAGLPFLRRANDHAKRRLAAGKTLNLSIQTNATLMTRETARFFADEGWLVGVSVDGPASVHDAHRRTASGEGTHASVLRGLDALRDANCDYNILVLVTRANVQMPDRIYRYVRDELGGTWQQYTDHLESLALPEWDAFLCGILDTWLADGDPGRVSVRNIDAALSYATLGRADQCIFGDRCDGHLVVERNGDIYPCDFFVSSGTRLGNILAEDWRTLREKPAARAFAARKCPRHLSCISRMAFYDRLLKDVLQPSTGDFGKMADNGNGRGLGVGHPETRKEPRDV